MQGRRAPFFVCLVRNRDLQLGPPIVRFQAVAKGFSTAEIGAKPTSLGTNTRISNMLPKQPARLAGASSILEDPLGKAAAPILAVRPIAANATVL